MSGRVCVACGTVVPPGRANPTVGNYPLCDIRLPRDAPPGVISGCVARQLNPGPVTTTAVITATGAGPAEGEPAETEEEDQEASPLEAEDQDGREREHG